MSLAKMNKYYLITYSLFMKNLITINNFNQI